MGPLELAHFVGLDTMRLIGNVLHEQFKETMYASPRLLTGLVEAGHLGRKAGRGFSRYG
jgi:3-hydroxybutyryl-CoA dehydrogenase